MDCILKHIQTCCRQSLPQLGQGALHQPWPASRSYPPTKAITTTSSSSTIITNAMAVHLVGSSCSWLRTPGGRPFNRSLWPLGEQARFTSYCPFNYQLPCQLPNITGIAAHDEPLFINCTISPGVQFLTACKPSLVCFCGVVCPDCPRANTTEAALSAVCLLCIVDGYLYCPAYRVLSLLHARYNVQRRCSHRELVAR